MKTLFKSSFLIFALLINVGIFAQDYKIEKTIPVNERECWFFYHEFVGSGEEPKALLISSYIFRRKHEFEGRHAIYDRNHLMNVSRSSMYKKIGDVDHNEHSHNLNEKMYSFKSVLDEWSFWRGSYADGTGDDSYNTYNSVTYRMVEVRNNLIKEYQDKGFTVFQIKFDEYDDEHFIKTGVEKVEQLSPTWIAYYRKGDLQNMAKNYHSSKNTKKSSSSSPKKSSSTKTTEVPYCTSQTWRVQNSIAQAEYLNTTEAWQEAKATYEDAYGKCGQSILNYIYLKNRIDKGLKDVALTNIVTEVMDAVGRSEIEGFMGENESEQENGTGLLQMGINYKFIFGLNQSYIRPYIGLGVAWTDLASYQLTYKNPTSIPNDLPSNESRIFLEKMFHLNFLAGLSGEIPLDGKNKPYNNFNLSWDLGGYIGYSIFGDDPLEKYKFTLLSNNISHDFLYGVRGSLGLELFFSEGFGLGVFGGLNYLFLKKELENTIVRSSDNYPIRLNYDAANHNYIYGIKLIFRR